MDEGGSMPQGQDPADIARTILDSNRYMTLGTADETGRPWVSPVWYAPDGYGRLFWVSDPEARHSQNIAARPEIGIVIFDSRAAIGDGQGVYMSAVAEQLSGADLERGIEVFSRRSVAQGAREWTLEEVRMPGLFRLYRATVSEHWVLDPAGRADRRTPVVGLI
jgi:uncharacterized protein YhbP (UPF0306 family)